MSSIASTLHGQLWQTRRVQSTYEHRRGLRLWNSIPPSEACCKCSTASAKGNNNNNNNNSFFAQQKQTQGRGKEENTSLQGELHPNCLFFILSRSLFTSIFSCYPSQSILETTATANTTHRCTLHRKQMK